MVIRVPDMMFRAARKLIGIDRMMPNTVAIMPMKIVSTMRSMVSISGSLAFSGPTSATCRAWTLWIWAPASVGGIRR